MTPRVTIDTADIPGGGGQLRLIRRGAEFSIMLGANELMNSRLSGSEEALAALSCGPIAGRQGARVLIGGLGMGFTLRAALGVLGADAEVVVAELVPAVVAWARGPLVDVFAGSMDDARVNIVENDVRRPIGESSGAFDAIMLDVDNGPDGLTRGSNDRLYDAAGLGAAWRALRPGGNLAVWSSAPDPRFTRALQDAGFAVEEVAVKARGARGARHVIWVATRS
jgi:spermidine synthase